jgi:hypothetical protein
MRRDANPESSDAAAALSAAAIVPPKPSATLSDWLPLSPVSAVSAVWTRSPSIVLLEVRAKPGAPTTALATGLPESLASSSSASGCATSSLWSLPRAGS